MSDERDELGPIDYAVVEFPGNRMTGRALPALVDLVDRGIIRVLDLPAYGYRPGRGQGRIG